MLKHVSTSKRSEPQNWGEAITDIPGTQVPRKYGHTLNLPCYLSGRIFFLIVLEPSQEQDNDRTLWKLMTETEY